MSVTYPSARLLLAWLLESRRFHGLEQVLADLPSDAWLVGGAVRDFILDRAADDVRDVDVVCEATTRDLHIAYADYQRVERTPFGNPRVFFGETYADIFPPQGPMTPVMPIKEVLWNFDASGNAIAVNLFANKVCDPTGGVVDLGYFRTSLLPLGWVGPATLQVSLLRRLIEQANRLQLHIRNLDIADVVHRNLRADGSLSDHDKRTVEEFGAWRSGRK